MGVTTYLVRHGKAGKRDPDDPHDWHRPLSEKGQRQADRLADLLADLPVERVLSSSALRCTQTVAPLAARRGLVVEVHPALAEGVDTDLTLELLHQLAAEGKDAVLCSHGDVIPDVIRRLGARGLDVSGPRGFEKGSVWTLDHDGERYTRGSYTLVPSSG